MLRIIPGNSRRRINLFNHSRCSATVSLSVYQPLKADTTLLNFTIYPQHRLNSGRQLPEAISLTFGWNRTARVMAEKCSHAFVSEISNASIYFVRFFIISIFKEMVAQ